MICKTLTLNHFRNIPHAEMTFSPGVNVLYGENAQGKTNILESIYYCALQKSFRTHLPHELVQYGETAADISTTFEREGKTHSVSCHIIGRRGGGRSVSVDELRADKLSDALGHLRVVLFSPEHLSLIKEGPEVRRNFLHVGLAQIHKRYLRGLRIYEDFLKERNALIKSRREGNIGSLYFDEMMDIVNEKIAAESSVMVGNRAFYLHLLNLRLKENYRSLTSKYVGRSEEASLSYDCSMGKKYADLSLWDVEMDEENPLYNWTQINHYKVLKDDFYRIFSASKEKDLAYGMTTVGPHRDDFTVYLNGRPAKAFASQGQQRTLVLALKLAEGDISTAVFDGDAPVYLFDDVLSELDSYRRDCLLDEMDTRQVILTTCNTEMTIRNHDLYAMDDDPDHQKKFILVEGGQVREMS